MATGGARRGHCRLSRNVSLLQRYLMAWTTAPAGCVDISSWRRHRGHPARGGSMIDLTCVAVARGIEPKILLVAQLQVVDTTVETWLRHQLVMRAALHNVSVFEHQNRVSLLQGAQPLCNHKRGAAGHECCEGLLNEILGFHVHTRGRVIEDQQARVARKGPRHRYALPLAA